MWWFKRKRPVKALALLSFSESKPNTFAELLCDGVAAHNLASFGALLALHARLQREHPEVRVLASLDNLGQAGYTSGHSIQTHDLDSIEGHDPSLLPADAFEDGEYAGFLSTPAAFPIRLANLLKAAYGIGIDQLAGLLPWETSGDQNDLVTVNRDPERALRIASEAEVLFQFVPVTLASEALAAFPNGYFLSDLDPMQNLAVAKRLEAAFGLSLFGVGSRYLGFRRDAAFTNDEARRLADEVVALYSDAPQAAGEELASVLTGRDWLLLRYTES